MRRDYLIAILLGLAAFPLAVAMMAAPLVFPDAPQVLLRLFFFGGLAISIGLVAAAIVVSVRGEERPYSRGQMISLVGMIVCAIGFIGFASWHFWPVQTDPKLPEKTAVAVPSVPAPPSAPSVALRFVYPKAPALVIVNDSEAVARDIKWTVVLWNLDLPDRDEPLPIPVTAFDWIRAHNLSGPQGLFGGALVPPLLKPGNRLFGTASVVCPDCDRGRTYIVYIVWDQGGWYSEIEDEKSGNVIIPVNLKGESRAAYFAMLVESAAPASRVPIGPLQ